MRLLCLLFGLHQLDLDLTSIVLASDLQNFLTPYSR